MHPNRAVEKVNFVLVPPAQLPTAPKIENWEKLSDQMNREGDETRLWQVAKNPKNPLSSRNQQELVYILCTFIATYRIWRASHSRKREIMTNKCEILTRIVSRH